MSIDCRPPLKRNIEDGIELPVMRMPVVRAPSVPALLNPRATIDEVGPLEFEPGEEIDLTVLYTPANDEEIRWQTVCHVIHNGTKLARKKQQWLQMAPGQESTVCNTGLDMPSTPIDLTIEVWGHPDYLETTWPDC